MGKPKVEAEIKKYGPDFKKVLEAQGVVFNAPKVKEGKKK